MPDEFAVVDLGDVDREPFPESGILHRKLGDVLRCTDGRVNSVPLQPGQATAPHPHERQEEGSVALDGGHVRIEDIYHVVSPVGVVRIGPDPVRSISNESEKETQTWLMFGAPPVGTVIDIGEYRMPDG